MEKGEFKNIKELVFDYVKKTRGKVNSDELAEKVLRFFPYSAWKDSHWYWYRYQITKGKYKNSYPESIKNNINTSLKPRSSPDMKVKKLGDVILKQARNAIAEASGQDDVLKFKLNRWVFSRLLQDEIQQKRPIKKKLWESGRQACLSCDEEFKSLKEVEIHRKDSSLPYSIENCELLCRTCHQKKL